MVDTVVSGQWEGFYDNIVGICRISQNFLETYDVGVKYQFADGVLVASQAVALIYRAVLQQKPCLLRIVKDVHTLPPYSLD